MTHPEEQIRELEHRVEDGFDESVMRQLEQAYLSAGETDKARKLARKIKRLYPSSSGTPGAVRSMPAASQSQGALSAAADSPVAAGKPEAVSEAAGARQTQPQSVTEAKQKSDKPERVIAEYVQDVFADTVGLKEIREALDRYCNTYRLDQIRSQRGYVSEIMQNANFIVCGGDGTGKTHTALLIAELLSKIGVRKKKAPVVIEFQDIINKYAYAKDPATEIGKMFPGEENTIVILENLNRVNRDRNLDWMEFFSYLGAEIKARTETTSFILTGRTADIEWMTKNDPSMIDSFPQILKITPYSPMELYQILEKLAKEQSFLIREDTRKLLVRKIDEACKTPDFQATRTLRQYLNEAVAQLSDRYFTTGDVLEKGKADLAELTPDDFGLTDEGENLEELLAQLDALVGLKGVKEQVKKRINAVEMDKKAQAAGANRKGGQGTMHLIFTGNPGTGKTTVARILGGIYRELGILPRGDKIVECSRGNLVGKYQGHSAANVQEKFRQAAGGVLFIDEAYSLCHDKNDSFGIETVDELVAQIENYKDSTMVILAGYSKDMNEFKKTNEGLTSRFRNEIEFEDYTVEEMAMIFGYNVSAAGMKLSEKARDSLRQMIEVKSKAPGFGNARGVRNLFDDVKEAQNERISGLFAMGKDALDKDVYDTIEAEDIELVAGRKMKCEKTVDDLLEELNGLTGLSGAKRKVQEIVAALRVKKEMEDRGLKSEAGFGTLHQVYYGNAGTGKTTVARIIGEIYAKLGVLKKNVFVEVSRADLVANYTGQTATKVMEKVEEADGGILFIDEAYTLNQGEHDEFGKEAIDTLVAQLENRRETLMVIVAGYEKEMDSFLETNQGLGSRFPSENRVRFEDYSPEELTDIFLQGLQKKKYTLDGEYREEITALIGSAMKRERNFGNARGVRNLIDNCIRRKNLRIAVMLESGQEVTNQAFYELQKTDLTDED